MRYLLDECLSDQVAKSLNVLAASSEFVHLLDVAAKSTDDIDIPAICKRESIDVLISINVKDFGARKHVYEAVIAAGIHVLVLRRKKGPPDSWWQASLLTGQYPRYNKLFEYASEATLGSLSESGVRELTLAQIMDEIKAQEERRSPLP